MKPLTPYLFFNGNCREALNFYKGCFGGDLQLMTYGDAPEEACPGGTKPDKDQIMHGNLTAGDFSLMASDNPVSAPITGDNISLSVNCETIPQTQQLFEALSKGGEVTLPLGETFWGAYFGMLVDQYGFRWMLNCPLEK